MKLKVCLFLRDVFERSLWYRLFYAKLLQIINNSKYTMFFLLISTLTGSNLRYKSIVNRSFHIRFSHYIPAASTSSTQKKRKSVNICTLYFTKNVNFCIVQKHKNVNFCTTLKNSLTIKMASYRTEYILLHRLYAYL